ncbi:MAG: rRNA maturation RNAse YbeY, partial [Bdellovibrionaceae bacterium]|nr:rRNA maturation RNAse YbeY [Pseudobdellovibrionaceae bacterium]
MKLTLVDESGYRIDEQWLQGQLDRVVASLQSRGYWPRSEKSKNICMVFLNRLEAKGINWKFRQKDYATDILSFESEDSET